MGKGRPWARALRSKVTPTGRWVPKTNSQASCVGVVLGGLKGGGRSGVKGRFIASSKACKAAGRDPSKINKSDIAKAG